MNTDVKIRDMQDTEIISLVETCSYMFGSYRIPDEALNSFAYLLRSKFPLMRGEKILQLCTDTAASPAHRDREIKFTPSVLAGIISTNETPVRYTTSMEKATSETERIKYRQQFLKDLYADFNAYKNGKLDEMKNIIVWDYVARQLVSAGFAERLPEIKHQTVRGEGNIRDTFSSYLPFVKECFDKLIKNNQHISEIIHGIN